VAQSISWLLPAAVLSAPLQAFAVEYLSLEQAQRALFPAASEFRARPTLLTEAQRDAIAKASNTRVRAAEVKLWEAHGATGLLGYVVVDQVLGKHELITYAVALRPDGQVAQVEVMDYRETYGGQIRQSAWRAQFAGKTARDNVQIDKDIQNISGATLSCVHVTDGIRRILATYEIAFKTPT
jgi:Na+-translocating ferredoxin:NAD+ oxidoreductase RnfG subunit